MKTKLEMAHEFSMKLVGNPTTPLKNLNSIMEASWQYADAMQAEADKRKSSEFPNVLRGACGEIVAVKVDDMEWQPDWSQAPMCDVVAWDINEHGQARWIASDNGYYLAPSFSYQGDWRDSLRKRPQ